MKFNVAWSEVLSQNVVLKVAILCLSFCLISLLVILMKLFLREPLIIERACYSSVIEKASSERTEPEITAFLKESLSRRFDTDAVGDLTFLSNEESQFREQEQKDLKEKGIAQRFIFNGIRKIDGTEIMLDADRLISVGPVRSAFPFALSVTIGSVRRTEGNSYGLRLIRVKPLEAGKLNGKRNEK